MRKIKLMKVFICICIFTIVLSFAACANHTDYDRNEEVSQTQINTLGQESEIVEEQGTEEAQEKTLESGPEAETVAESKPETETRTDLYEPVEVSEIDYDSFQSRMTDEEWEGFQQYFPVLKENVVFHYVNVDDGEVLNKNGEPWKEGEYGLYVRYMSKETLDINRYMESYYEDGATKMKVSSIQVFDLDGDGVQELIIEWTPFGDLLVLHCEKGEFYGWGVMCRGFERLQTNGIYIGSSGASANRWKRIQFDNGSWLEEVLLQSYWEEYYVSGEATDEDTFWQQVGLYKAELVPSYKPVRRTD